MTVRALPRRIRDALVGLGVQELRALSILVALIFTFTACGGPSLPTIGDVKKVLEAEQIKTETGKAVYKVSSITKINGMDRTFMGVRVYELHYKAEIEATVTHWRPAMLGGHAVTSKPASTHFMREVPAGTKTAREGRMVFELTENGWRKANM